MTTLIVDTNYVAKNKIVGYVQIQSKEMKILSFAEPDDICNLMIKCNPNLEQITNFPKNLKKLILTDNPNLKSLPVFPENLEELFLFNNPNLKSLPVLPENLKELIYKDNVLIFPNFPKTLRQVKIEISTN